MAKIEPHKFMVKTCNDKTMVVERGVALWDRIGKNEQFNRKI